MDILYFAPGACSFVPHVGLELMREVAGREYETRLVKLHKGEHKLPEFLALNPDGQVPVLLANSQPISQLIAICDYLDRACPQAKLLPAEPTARAEAMSVLAWMNNTVHSTFAHVFLPHLFTDSLEAQAIIKAYNTLKYRKYLQRLDAMAASRPALWNGAEPNLLDAYAFTLLRWGGIAGVDPGSLPHLKALVERALAHSALATVLARERVGLDTFKG
jgi:glutathione S-transferase